MNMSSSLNLFKLAERLSIPQLVEAIKRGTIDPTIGQLVLNNKVQQQKKLQQAQASQQPERPPVASENMMSGIAQMPVSDNMYGAPGMAGGGIVGYADGGDVMDGLMIPPGPVGTDSDLKKKLGLKYSRIANTPDDKLKSNTDFQDKRAAQMLLNRLDSMSTQELKQIDKFGLEPLKNFDPSMVMPRTKSPFTAENPMGIQPRQMPPPMEDDRGPNIPSFPGASVPAMNLRGYEDLINGQDRAGRFRELSKQREGELAQGDTEAFKGIKNMLQRQRGNISDVDKKNLYLSLISGGLAAASGDSQYALQNIARGGEQGVNNYIQRDVLNRANEQQLAQNEQLMKLQELATAKGNRSLADQYAQGIAGLEQNDTGLRMQAINSSNQNELNKAQLGLQAAGLNQNAAIQRANIANRGQYFQAQSDLAKARQMGVLQKAASEFMDGMQGKNIEADLRGRYGANWRNIPDAQFEYNSALKSYVSRRAEILNAMGGGDMGGGIMGGVPDADMLEQQGTR